MAREGGFPFHLFWDVVRGESPLSRQRLAVQGELLQMLGDALLIEKDGYALIKRLRLRPPDHGGEIPAIAVTAHCRASDRARAMSSGYQMFLHKPVDISELIGAVRFLASVRKQ